MKTIEARANDLYNALAGKEASADDSIEFLKAWQQEDTVKGRREGMEHAIRLCKTHAPCPGWMILKELESARDKEDK